MTGPGVGDDLTSREREVLALVREGLTNEQIAKRLGISLDGAKYHVSQILSKLQVPDRLEAARWYGRSTRRQRLAPAAWLALLKRRGVALKIAGLGLGGALILGLAALALGLGLANRPAQTPEAPGRTGNEVLDGIIDSLLEDDAAGLGARFAGVPAREGGVIGGPVGIFGVRPVADTEWTGRLGGSLRALHAVVKNPQEPFDWWDQPPSPQPRASVFAGARDFDVVLIVEENGATNPWRFSVLDGAIVDIVIDSGRQSPSGAPSMVPLARRLGYLTPSPDDDPASFLVMPDERNLPPPPALAPTGGRAPQPPPAPVRAPANAPAGRTGDAGLDSIIESLLQSDLNTLRARYSRLPGRDEEAQARVPVADWTDRLAAANRALYAAFTGDPLDAEIVIAVSTGGATENWKFGVDNGQVVDLAIRSRALPSLSREYARFYVVPSPQDGPRPPSNHPLSVRSSLPAVDNLLAVLQAHNPDALRAALAGPSELLVRAGQDCNGGESLKDAAFATSWAASMAAEAYGVHAVVTLPAGYQPVADHLIILVTQQNPFSWESVGIAEREGRVVLLITGGCSAERLYPPSSYVVPPPVGGITAVATGRRSGLPAVDRLLAALEAGNAAAVAPLIRYQPVACSRPGDIGALPCPAGTATGTAIDALPMTACEGGYSLPGEAPASLIEATRGMGLYAVVATPPAPSTGLPGDAAGWTLLLGSRDQGSRAISLDAQGLVTGVRAGCFVSHPEWLIGNPAPAFLLPPP